MNNPPLWESRLPRSALARTAMALGLAVACGVASHSLGTVDDTVQAVARTEYAQAQLIEIDQSLTDLANAARAYERTRDPADSTAVLRLRRGIDGAIDRLDALVTTPGLMRNGLDALAALARDREERANEIVTDVRDGDLKAARFLLEQGEGRGSQTDAVRATLASLQIEARRVLSLDRQAIARTRNVFLVALWVSGTFGLLLLALLAQGFSRVRWRRGKEGSDMVDLPESL